MDWDQVACKAHYFLFVDAGAPIVDCDKMMYFIEGLPVGGYGTGFEYLWHEFFGLDEPAHCAVKIVFG